MAIHSEDVSDFPFIGYRGKASLNTSKEINDKLNTYAEGPPNGSNADGIITHVLKDLELYIVGVSRLQGKNNHTHYINDRNKIAINLKKMILMILRRCATSNPSTLKDLVLSLRYV